MQDILAFLMHVKNKTDCMLNKTFYFARKMFYVFIWHIITSYLQH